MATVFRNATLVQFDPPRVEVGDLRQVSGRIIAAGSQVPAEPDDEVVDCGGAVLMPGLINGHTHLYSALAAGMPAPPKTPTNFHEILRYVWWRLDRAHDLPSVACSGRIGALTAARCGVTTLIDHHASPEAIDGSLDALEEGIATVGCRGVTCYEVTDRNRPDEAQRGLDENERYIGRCKRRTDGRFAGMVGAHASFTLGEESLTGCVDLAERLGVGVHIHVAEDPCDEQFTRRDHGVGLIKRFERCELLNLPGTLLAHGTHLGEEGFAAINGCAAEPALAHNPSSNMNNAVGYTPIVGLDRTPLLGTDGIGCDLVREARVALFESHDEKRAIPFDLPLRMLATSARFASRCLGVELGVLEPGAAADLVLMRAPAATPLHAGNIAGHLIYAMGAEQVRSVMIDGRWVLRDGAVVSCDEVEITAASGDIARGLHERMAAFACD